MELGAQKMRSPGKGGSLGSSRYKVLALQASIRESQLETHFIRVSIFGTYKGDRLEQ